MLEWFSFFSQFFNLYMITLSSFSQFFTLYMQSLDHPQFLYI